jgi:hypothetical protein
MPSIVQAGINTIDAIHQRADIDAEPAREQPERPKGRERDPLLDGRHESP